MNVPRCAGAGNITEVLEEEADGANAGVDTQPSTLAPKSGRHGTTPLPWDQYWDQQQKVELPDRHGTFNVYSAGTKGAVLFLLHGAGYTGLTWSLVAKSLKDKYRVVAPDLRGHGQTHSDDDLDLSSETLAADVAAIHTFLFGESEEKIPTVLVGHSMGGAIAVWVAVSKQLKQLEGLVVVDVVEGTALAALPHMMHVVDSRPTQFKSIDEAIAWSIRTGMSKNREAAAVSIPSQLTSGDGKFFWRTPLAKSSPYWEGWYTGLSDAFLKATCPKMLLLAGTDRLDKVLTIGQMQGKFQLVLMPTAGHAIQEDEADKTAEHLLQFVKRFRVGEPPMQFPKAASVKPVLPVVAGPTL